MLVTQITGFISSWSTLVIPVLFLVLRPQRLQHVHWLILVYSLLLFSSDRLQDLHAIRGIQFHISFVFVLLEYALLSTFMYIVLQKKRNRRWVIAGSGLFALLAAIAWVQWGASLFGSIRGISVILLISYILFFYLEWITAENFEPIQNRVEFWMVTGALFYLAGNFFYFITIHNPIKEGLLIHNMVNMLRNAAFATAIIQSYNTGKYSNSNH